MRTLNCTAEGVFIWPGAALVERHGSRFVRASEREICNRAGVLHGSDVIYGPLIPTLEHAARYLERGQLAKAQAAIAMLKLPPLSATGEQLTRGARPDWTKEFDPDQHPRWPAGSPDSTGGQFAPADEADGSSSGGEQVAQEMMPFFARPPIFPDEEPEFKVPIPRLSGKEGAKDASSWARGQRPYVGESGRDFAKRVMDGKYGPGKWNPKGAEFRRIQKYGDRSFRDPKAILPPDDNEA